MRHFPYIKQNSIAEIVSTMESFLVAGVGFESIVKKAKCEQIPPPSHSRAVSLASLLRALLALGGFGFEKTVINCFLLAYPTSTARRSNLTRKGSEAQIPRQRKSSPIGLLLSFV